MMKLGDFSLAMITIVFALFTGHLHPTLINASSQISSRWYKGFLLADILGMTVMFLDCFVRIRWTWFISNSMQSVPPRRTSTIASLGEIVSVNYQQLNAICAPRRTFTTASLAEMVVKARNNCTRLYCHVLSYGLHGAVAMCLPSEPAML